MEHQRPPNFSVSRPWPEGRASPLDPFCLVLGIMELIYTLYPPQNTRTGRFSTVSWAVPSCHTDRHHWFGGGGRDGLGSGGVYPCTGLCTIDNHTVKGIPHDTVISIGEWGPSKINTFININLHIYKCIFNSCWRPSHVNIPNKYSHFFSNITLMVSRWWHLPKMSVKQTEIVRENNSLGKQWSKNKWCGQEHF